MGSIATSRGDQFASCLFQRCVTLSMVFRRRNHHEVRECLLCLLQASLVAISFEIPSLA